MFEKFQAHLQMGKVGKRKEKKDRKDLKGVEKKGREKRREITIQREGGTLTYQGKRKKENSGKGRIRKGTGDDTTHPKKRRRTEFQGGGKRRGGSRLEWKERM